MSNFSPRSQPRPARSYVLTDPSDLPRDPSELERELEQLRYGLSLIAVQKCKHTTSMVWVCPSPDSVRRREGLDDATRWCDPCIAAEALGWTQAVGTNDG